MYLFVVVGVIIVVIVVVVGWFGIIAHLTTDSFRNRVE